jgi:integrase
MSPTLPMRDGTLTVRQLIELYMQHYTGRDPSRSQRCVWWCARIGHLRLDEVSDDHLHTALEDLATRPALSYAGTDDKGDPLFNFKKRALSGATVNRYHAGISAIFTWAIRKRITPKGWDHPGRRIERRPESSGKTRFLGDDERRRLLEAAKACGWPKMYLLVLTALTTGARRGELLGLRWQDVDALHSLLHIARSKNGDAKALPLTPPVREEFERLRAQPTALVFASERCPEDRRRGRESGP